jgi:hypothetical protein
MSLELSIGGSKTGLRKSAEEAAVEIDPEVGEEEEAEAEAILTTSR